MKKPEWGKEKGTNPKQPIYIGSGGEFISLKGLTSWVFPKKWGLEKEGSKDAVPVK